MKRCVVTADDFALNADIDDGILALIEAGRVTGTSCLTTSPRWHESARRLSAAVRARADVGLHLDLTEFERIGSSHASLIVACYTRVIDAKRLRAMMRTQLQRFEDALDTAPDYVDGHRHVHQLPIVRDALIELLVDRYPARKPWIRVSRDGAHAGYRGRLITWLGSDGLSESCRAAGVATNDRLLGLYDFKDDAPGYRARLSAWLEEAQDGDVLTCHPAARIFAGDPIGRARLTEFEAMCSRWWNNCLESHQITLCRGVECVRL